MRDCARSDSVCHRVVCGSHPDLIGTVDQSFGEEMGIIRRKSACCTQRGEVCQHRD